MSFGYSVGGFLTAGILAWKLYSKCRDSVEEFKSISGEVRGLHIVLEAIADHWKANDLLPKHRQNLEILTESSLDALHELELVLSSHESLRMRKTFDLNRLKWAAKNIAPVRSKLVDSATLLAMFHDTVTATANLTILRSLDILMRDFQTGRREAPAFSQLSRHSIQNEEEDTWSVVTDELLTSGADATSIHAQRDLIKAWIDHVCILEVTEEVAESAERESNEDPNNRTSHAPSMKPSVESLRPLSHSPHAFQRWETLSSHWEGLTSYWMRRLKGNTDALQGQPILEQMKKQLTDLSAAGANLFHAVVELQRLRQSSERKVKRWFFETRAEREQAREKMAKVEEELQDERQRRDAATKLLLNT